MYLDFIKDEINERKKYSKLYKVWEELKKHNYDGSFKFDLDNRKRYPATISVACFFDSEASIFITVSFGKVDYAFVIDFAGYLQYSRELIWFLIAIGAWDEEKPHCIDIEKISRTIYDAYICINEEGEPEIEYLLPYYEVESWKEIEGEIEKDVTKYRMLPDNIDDELPDFSEEGVHCD